MGSLNKKDHRKYLSVPALNQISNQVYTEGNRYLSNNNSDSLLSMNCSSAKNSKKERRRSFLSFFSMNGSPINEKIELAFLNPLDLHIGPRTWNTSSLLEDNVQTDSGYFSSSCKHENQPIKGTNLSMTELHSVSRGPTDPYGSAGAPLITKNFETSEVVQSSRSSKARQKKFHRHFKQVDGEEKVLNYYSCALVGDILLQGHLYITENFFAFYSNVFGYVTKLLIPTADVLKISKEKTAKIIPNAVGISTEDEKHVFGSLLSRDSTYKFMLQVWKAANTTNPTSKISTPPAIKTELPTDEDSSLSTGNEDQSYISNLTTPASSGNFPNILPKMKRKSILMASMEMKRLHWYSFKVRTLLVIALALLVFLMGSAGFLLYRIAIIQNNFHDLTVSSKGNEGYEDIVKWQSIRYSKSANRISEFLTTNLNQIVKVRLSLEALSMLLLPSNGKFENSHTNSKWENTDVKKRNKGFYASLLLDAPMLLMVCMIPNTISTQFLLHKFWMYFHMAGHVPLEDCLRCLIFSFLWALLTNTSRFFLNMDDRTIDLIFAGSLESLPPVSSKIVRIFTSSTFTDTTMERNTLMAQCYPKLKDYCREKHGLEFQVVDMRWGVRDEATDDHMTTELCMREIKNCQRLSMGPNFVVFLGQKYGYRPIPTYILSSELQLLRDELASVGTDVSLLDTWYRKDSNAVPPVSVLQPISSILVNFNNKRIPKLQQHDQAVWWDTLGKMQKLFRKAAQSLYNSGKFDRDTMHNYFMSVTEREVINGILNVKNTKNHCLAYLRYINNINLQNLKKASLYLDIINRSLDTEASKLLANLRDERVPARIETTNLQRYTVEWIGREGLDTETHEEYLQHFITHFYKNITKLVDRAMRKEDSSAQGQIVTEILQHLHACNNSVKVFCGREDHLIQIENYMKSECDKPIVLYGEGGCGKTSLLAKAASLTSSQWFPGVKPIIVVRFLGTTPDSSALTPTLISICQQISYNYMLPYEDIPDDLVPLTAHFKHLLTCASQRQPLFVFLDSVDQLTGTQDSNKVSWLPTRLPSNCKLMVTCAAEAENPEVSKEYHLLRRMIDVDNQFIEVTALGEELAMQVIKMWMADAHRDLSNYQWRLVANAIGSCSLPIFVKLVFAEICRWRSYTKPQDTHLASTVMDSIMMLFERIEKQHGRILVFHALAYITAAKSGLSESELEDLISLDDRVLDDVYQYHLPPVRRIPPLLWTRIRNDLPNYLSEREADGVSVMNWYHRQFRDTAKERYFKNMNMALYFHSSIADYYLGIWGGGNPKPFKYTEIQRHRFNLTDKEGSADRKVPIQPLVFYSKDGKVSRYNLRKFNELPYHMVRARRFTDLYKHVLFNYEWLHAKLSSCPLQAVLSDFEDACNNTDNREAVRELMLVADALRLGGAILSVYPDMLAPQLIGRLLPESDTNANIKMLLNECDIKGLDHCALLPLYHCLHTPGGPLKYSLEGHQFAVFGFCLTSDYRYIVSVSNKFITWDLSTSDLTRDINPGIEGIMQDLVLSPDNKYVAAYTNNNQIVFLNTLTSEFITLNSPLPEGENVCGVYLLNAQLFVYGEKTWCRFNVRGALEETGTSPEDDNKWKIFSMEWKNLTEYKILFWTGDLDNPEMAMRDIKSEGTVAPFYFHSAVAFNKSRNILYCCPENNSNDVAMFKFDAECLEWKEMRKLPVTCNRDTEVLLQLKLDAQERTLLGSTCNGFVIWNLGLEEAKSENFSTGFTEIETVDRLGQNVSQNESVVLSLPHGVRNISTKILESNSIMLDSSKKYAVAGVRKNLYVWCLKTKQLVKILDAHFARIISLEPLTIGNWNLVITSSIDRTVKVWNINNIFEQVHVIDRHELQIDSIGLSQVGIAVTVTRSCVGVWDIMVGKLIARLADSPLGAIVTHAAITQDGRYIVSAESGNIIIWNRLTEMVLFKEEQAVVKQLTLLENGTKFLTISKPPAHGNNIEAVKHTAVGILRSIPDGSKIYSFELPVKSASGTNFKTGVVTSDGQHLVFLASDKNSKDILMVFNAKTGAISCKIPIRSAGVKDPTMLISMPNKTTQVAVIDADKGSIFDLKSKRFVRSVPKWGGICTKDGRTGLYAPSRGGLELLELRKGATVQTYIPKVAEGVFTVICMFNKTDEYVLYYHSGRKTVRVFRTFDAELIANYRVQAELSAVETTDDGKCVVLGTVDGCLSVFAIADPRKPDMKKYLASLPSRDEQWKKKLSKMRASTRFKAAASIAKLSTQFSNSTCNSDEEE